MDDVSLPGMDATEYTCNKGMGGETEVITVTYAKEISYRTKVKTMTLDFDFKERKMGKRANGASSASAEQDMTTIAAGKPVALTFCKHCTASATGSGGNHPTGGARVKARV
ncbi:MAG: hypothetical protein Q9227_006610 [Pyrenula ochraceoflavens]